MKKSLLTLIAILVSTPSFAEDKKDTKEDPKFRISVGMESTTYSGSVKELSGYLVDAAVDINKVSSLKVRYSKTNRSVGIYKQNLSSLSLLPEIGYTFNSDDKLTAKPFIFFGFERLQATSEYYGYNGKRESSMSSNGFAYGVGARVEYAKTVSLAAEYKISSTYFTTRSPDLESLSIMLGYKF